MYVDFAIIDTDTKEKEAKDKISEVITHGINSVTIPQHFLKLVKSICLDNNVSLSSFVDFPLGISSQNTRIESIKNIIKQGANCIDVTIPQILATNRKYDKIRSEMSLIKEVCDPIGVKIRYILEYRTFDHRCLKKVCEILDDNDIKDVFPSTGFFIDNLADNILASVFLHQNSKEVNVIATGNAWTEHHYNIIARSGIYGIRTFSTHIVKDFEKYSCNYVKKVYKRL